MARQLFAGAAVVVTFLAFSSAHATATTKTVHRSPLPTVDTKTTPPGWVPLDYGEAQISVPATWVIGAVDCPGYFYGEGWINLSGVTQPISCPHGTARSSIVESVLFVGRYVPPSPQAIAPLIVNGIPVDVIMIQACPQPEYCEPVNVPRLGISLSLIGPQSERTQSLVVLHTLTRSPRTVALAPGSSPPVPKSWHRVGYGGINAAVPRSWPVESFGWGECPPTNLSLPLRAVLKTSGTAFSGTACVSKPYLKVASPTDGLLIDPGQYGPLSTSSTYARCFEVHDLSVCPTTSDPYDVLVAALHVPGRAQPVAIEIGLSGNGMTARTILHSLRAG